MQEEVGRTDRLCLLADECLQLFGGGGGVVRRTEKRDQSSCVLRRQKSTPTFVFFFLAEKCRHATLHNPTLVCDRVSLFFSSLGSWVCQRLPHKLYTMVPPSLGNPFSTKTFFNWATRIFKRKRKQEGGGVGTRLGKMVTGDSRPEFYSCPFVRSFSRACLCTPVQVSLPLIYDVQPHRTMRFVWVTLF